MRADDLGIALLPAFDTPSGLPIYSVNPETGKGAQGWVGGSTILSEALSCQLEYKYLAYLTGRTQYYTAVENIMNRMYAEDLTWSKNLLPTMFNTQTGSPSSSVSSCLSLVNILTDSVHRNALCGSVFG